MNLIEKLNWRYATKRMNGAKVPEEKINTILESIRLTPTSMGLQAFKVLVIEKENLKIKIFEGACQQPQIKEASHLLVFAANKKVTADLVDQHIVNIASTRSTNVADLSGFRAMFNGIISSDTDQNFAWTSRQTYIALGVALVAAADEKIDATPIEGFNRNDLDEILGLDAQNLGSVLILALGYRDAAIDKLAFAPKVRKQEDELIVRL